MTSKQLWRGLLVSLAATALMGSAGVAFAGTPTEGRVILPSPVSEPPTGESMTADPSTELHMRVFLAGRDGAGRVRTALAVSDPDSPLYADFLTPAQYRLRFGATQEQAAQVRDWLTGQGMTVTVSTEHYLAVDATVGQAATAFGTEFRAYHMGTGKESYWQIVPVGDVSVPAGIGRAVAAVNGLTAFAWGASAPRSDSRSTGSRQALEVPPAQSARTAAVGDDTYPCSHYWGEHRVSIPMAYGRTAAPTEICGYTPTQMRQAYGVQGSPYTGKGASVAIVLDGRSPTMEADANRFFAAHGVAGFKPGQYTENLPPDFDCSEWPDGDNPEEALDVETVHMIAPDAEVVFVSAGCAYGEYDFLDAHTRVVDDHLADVVSNSWPGIESDTSPAMITAWELILQQGAIEGIGMNFASGDYGDGSDDSLGKAKVPFPTSDPWATGVGGTSLAIGAGGKVLGEWGWGDTVTAITDSGYAVTPPGTFLMGSGGGLSTKIAQPAYQRGVVPETLATAGGTVPARRVVPDVSADAGAFWLVGYTAPGEPAPVEPGDPGPSDTDPAPGPPVYAERPVGGGTSGSSPLLAALEADAKQATGHALGFVNPALYRLAGTRAVHDILPVNPHDPPITAGIKYCTGDADAEPCLTTLGANLGLTVTPGFDDVTGIGTPTNSFITAFRRF
ncbi:S53 family peptidase [Paractinoplanes durhamensis]|uniref:Serine protease n=1 Tax=Paractinoplanes durhamensis TaxID=113563 RepID=A0ABQ3ZDA7_9ACTN|nr:S53 family peptidase [Actinoplanes durhamensis]GIE07790.1 serine protease [Actinoplanes durhamensis]